MRKFIHSGRIVYDQTFMKLTVSHENSLNIKCELIDPIDFTDGTVGIEMQRHPILWFMTFQTIRCLLPS